MRIRNLFITVVVAALACTSVFAGDGQDVAKELEELRAMLKAQNKKISALQEELNETRTGYAQVADDAIVKLGNSSKGLEIKGDLRIRYEQRDLANNDPDGDNPNPDIGVSRRRRFRHRFRLGMKWSNGQNWTVAAGLATGGSGATSTNQTWDNNFQTGDIRLDYAYATHKWGNTSVSVGQQKNPYINAGILFDSDVRPTGVTVQQTMGPGFVTAGAYNMFDGTNEGLGYMFAVQGGVKLKNDGPVSATVALGYYVFNDPFIDDVGLNDEDLVELTNEDYRFELLDLYAEVKLKLGEKGEAKFYSQFTRNLGAPDAEGAIDAIATSSLGSQAGDSIDPASNNNATVIGVAVKYDRFKASLDRVSTKADSMPDSINDADFGSGVSGTDVEGYRLKLGVALTKKCSLGFTYLKYERKEEYSWDIHNVSEREGELYQLDLAYKF